MDVPKKIGPLPTWSFIVVVVGGLGLSYWLYSRGYGGGSDDSPTIVEDTSPQPGVGQLASGWMYTPPAAPVIADTDFDTNQEWARHVIKQMIAQGYPPSAVDSAVRKYLQGLGLNAQEAELRDIFLAKYGPPPYVSVPAEPDEDTPTDPNTTPTPTPATGLPAPTGLTVTDVGGGKIHVTWNPVPNAPSGYWCRIRGGAYGAAGKTLWAILYGPQMTFSGVKAGVYTIEVAARNGWFTYAYGGVATATITMGTGAQVA